VWRHLVQVMTREAGHVTHGLVVPFESVIQKLEVGLWANEATSELPPTDREGDPKFPICGRDQARKHGE
jgi:hypothetical protein